MGDEEFAEFLEGFNENLELRRRVDEIVQGANERNYCRTCHGFRPDQSLRCLNCGEVD